MIWKNQLHFSLNNPVVLEGTQVVQPLTNNFFRYSFRSLEIILVDFV